MARPHQLARLRRRAQHLDPDPAADPRLGGSRPDPAAEIAAALRPLWLSTLPIGLLLLVAAGAAAFIVGDSGACLLAGLPGGLLTVCWLAGTRPDRRRVAMVAATSASGFLALATVGAPAGLTELSGPVAYQLAALLLACVHLALSWPAWRRVERVGATARAALALYVEL